MSIRTNSLSAWIKAFRLKTLGASICPVFIGSSFALREGIFTMPYFLLLLTTAILLQILANIVNDYGDFIKGIDTINRLGPPRAMQMGFITEVHMKFMIIFISLICILLGIFLVIHGGWLVLCFGLLGLCICFWYSLGKWPLSHFGIIEIIIFFIFGPIEVLGSYFIYSLSFKPEVLLLSIAPGCLAASLSLTNNLRDISEDSLNHKKTLAVRLGEKLCRYLLILLVLLSFLSPILLFIIYDYSLIIFLSLFSLIPLIKCINIILFMPISKQFNIVLESLGYSMLCFAILFSLGIVYAAPKF